MQIFKFQIISLSESGREINNIQCIFYPLKGENAKKFKKPIELAKLI